MARVTSFRVQGDGSRSFSVAVNGLRVLVTAGEGHHDAGLALANTISALGPETEPTATVEPARPTPVPVAPAPAKRRNFHVGQRVWCNVHGSRGYTTVAEVGVGRNSGRIKIANYRAWCPVHNFDESAPGEVASSQRADVDARDAGRKP
jgi:hypothetical protein